MSSLNKVQDVTTNSTNPKHFYKLLGLEEGASKEAFKEAYKRMEDRIKCLETDLSPEEHDKAKIAAYQSLATISHYVTNKDPDKTIHVDSSALEQFLEKKRPNNKAQQLIEAAKKTETEGKPTSEKRIEKWNNSEKQSESSHQEKPNPKVDDAEKVVQTKRSRMAVC